MQHAYLPLSIVALAALSIVEPVRAVAPPRAEAPKTFAVQTVKNIAYYKGPGEHEIKHKLDLYLPRDLKDFPVLFFVHGGAWMHGDKDFFGVYSVFASAYARQGIGVVVINYRLSPAVAHPEHAKDVARAFAWTHNNIAKHGGRSDRVFLAGHSAGAHLVSLITTDPSYLKEHGLNSKVIRGVIPISGPFIIPDRFLPQVFGNDSEVRKKASPITHVRAGLPPFLVLCAENDFPGCGKVPCEAFCKALKGKGGEAELIEVRAANHVSILASAGRGPTKVFGSIAGFIRNHTGK